MARTEQEAPHRSRPGLRGGFAVAVVVVIALLFGVPWWTVVSPWSDGVLVVGTLIAVGVAVAFPVLMFFGHGRGRDWAARVGDTVLGVVWVLFAWSLIGQLLRLVLLPFGVVVSARVVAVGVLVVGGVVVGWGVWEAMRVPRVRRVDVELPSLAPGLDGVTVVVLADTHYGPIDRTRWSRRTMAAVNALAPDIVCHAGDIADGTVAQRRVQAAPLGDVRAALAKVYVTGNHEYFGEAQGWLDHMDSLGWSALHNRHVVVERGGARLVVAGVDDVTANGVDGHGPRLDVALAGAPGGVPVLLVAHQPRMVAAAAAAGVDLQVSGHTHGGQIWPFHYLVRVDQPTVRGLSRHGATQLYTSRGTGFWGPPLRVFAPSEITVLSLRVPPGGATVDRGAGS